MVAFDCALAPRRARLARDAGRGGYVRIEADAATYDVTLVGSPGDELAFVRAIRTTAKLSLAEALDIHAYAGRVADVTLVAGVSLEAASQLVRALDASHVTARLSSSTIATPMVCRPGLA